ncbi:hypothetical protein QH494_08060 [Sphingomonas sp. AR_OL41]|uniref:hypothetical protein n=1 Tax=Sphingomonas sp. AR_OL41 TaxID=3042729 RepID=UPI0024812120|nr:hypothetical protein [Sphingomonas sp. AR_OL41]MDH7972137.1 hypothetical protein [Sphingomonas sp. AR_OL41]
MVEDAFETVAIVYSQPETVVMLAMFTQYDIPAYAVGFDHARAAWPMLLALGGIIVRVHPAAADEARALLAEVAQRPAVIRPRFVINPVLHIAFGILAMMLAAPPPTRATATYFLGNARRAGNKSQG